MTQHLILNQSAQAFFLEQFSGAPKALTNSISETTKSYLAETLAAFIQPHALGKELNRPDVWSLCLFDLLKLAIESEDSKDRLEYFKVLGDKSLYISGFFQDSFNRKSFDINYYSSMGRTAYLQSFHLAKVASTQKKKAWEELSHTFLQAIELIAYVADSALCHSNKNILGVYERWTKTKSKRLYNILVEAGIDPIFFEQSDMTNAS
jgi:hypothetical protein